MRKGRDREKLRGRGKETIVKKQRNNIVQCRCGLSYPAGYQEYHQRGIWHNNVDQAVELRNRGLSFAEIARQLGMTRAYVSQRFKILKENEIAA